MTQIKIRKTVLSDSLQLEGLAQFLGQDVEISITLVNHPVQPPQANFMRFAGIAQTETAVLEALEADIETNRQLDLGRDLKIFQTSIMRIGLSDGANQESSYITTA